MSSLLLALMFGVLALVLLDGNWRAGLVMTVAIGFLQDPVRKITPGQPSTMVGLALVAFALTLLVLYDQNKGRFNLPAMFWAVPQIQDWVPAYFMLIAAQAVNSFLRFGDPVLTGLGVAFYVAPAIALWAGYQVACSPRFLQRLILVYLAFCFVWSISAWMDLRGISHPILEEVGEGIMITFEGFSARGVTGLWRTSEVASWHLAAGACLAITMAVGSIRRESQVLFLTLAAFFSYMTIPTGRRKSLVLVLVFAAVYLLLFSRKASPESRERVLTSIFGTAALAYAGYVLFLISASGDAFEIYLNRTLTTQDDLVDRFNVQGVAALQRGIEVSQGLGLGVGAGSNTGNLRLTGDAFRQTTRGLSFAIEGGGGRITTELGIPGLVIGSVVVALILLTVRRNFRMLGLLQPQLAYLLLGLEAFALANLVFFFSAAQVYSDPFILILLGLCFGSFLAVPTLIARQQAYQQQFAMAAAAAAAGSEPGR